MFDISFWELVVIAVVALIVVGPEEFPALVRGVSQSITKIRRYINAVRADMEFEVERVEELKRLVAEESAKSQVNQFANQLRSSVAVPTKSPVQVTTEQKDELIQPPRPIENPTHIHATQPDVGAKK
ncbi:MAG: sec-independent protein translocase protein TatB [Halothiobacillaceae bacterium]|nr:MAG: sec-independent protein translocase protein TatB [Halothiobacillaceae bacterium]